MFLPSLFLIVLWTIFTVEKLIVIVAFKLISKNIISWTFWILAQNSQGLQIFQFYQIFFTRPQSFSRVQTFYMHEFFMRKRYRLLFDLNLQIIIKIAELLMRNPTPTFWWQISCPAIQYFHTCFLAYKRLTKK